MSGSKSKVKTILFSLLIGFILCCVLVAAAGVVIYKASGRDMKGKIKYVLKKSEENVRMYAQQHAIRFRSQVIHEKDDKAKDPLRLTIDASRSMKKISPLIYGSNLTSKTEFEMDVAKFAKQIGITNVRFPGGGSMGYRWKQAKFQFNDRFDQAPLSNMENVIKFCRIMGAELMIQVNVESGSAREAAEWVRYMNEGPGNMRVEYWELGNEVYGDWDKAYMSGEDYARLIKEYAAAMKAVDPTVKIGANWGGARYQQFDEDVLRLAADNIDFVSYHWYPNHVNRRHKYKGRAHPLAKEIMANALAVEKIVSRFEELVETLAPQRKGEIEFTIMEWDGSWDAVPTDLEFKYRGMTWSLANAIFHADALGQFAKHGIPVANQYVLQEIMHGLIRGWDRQAGWGGSRWDGETIRPKALAIQLFARHFGDVLIDSWLDGSPTYYKEVDWRADSYSGQVPYISTYASLSTKDRTLRIALINKHADRDYKVNIEVKGAIVDSKGEAWILNGPSLEAQNDGSPRVVDISKYELTDLKSRFSYNVPPHSVNMLRLPLRELLQQTEQDQGEDDE